MIFWKAVVVIYGSLMKSMSFVECRVNSRWHGHTLSTVKDLEWRSRSWTSGIPNNGKHE